MKKHLEKQLIERFKNLNIINDANYRIKNYENQANSTLEAEGFNGGLTNKELENIPYDQQSSKTQEAVSILVRCNMVRNALAVGTKEEVMLATIKLCTSLSKLGISFENTNRAKNAGGHKGGLNPTERADRNLKIIEYTHPLIDRGMSYTSACKNASNKFGLSEPSIRKIVPNPKKGS